MSHISESQFHALCFGWMEKQQRLTRPRGWQLKEYYRGEKRAFYLSLCNCTVSRPISDDPPLDLGREDDLIEEEEEVNLFVDPQELQVHVEGISYTYEYHIAYSPIFSVPVLYFQAYDRDGKMLGFEDHWSLIPKMHQDEANRRIMISQGEHPALGISYFFIHPCETATILEAFIGKSLENYLVSWIGIYGPVVGLYLSASDAYELIVPSE